MPTGWRIIKAAHRDHAYDGEGARLYGGRWNGPGFAMIYTAESIALAVLEILVHIERQDQLKNYQLGAVNFPDSTVERLDLERLPHRWRKSPGPVSLQEIGNGWLASSASAILQVPSVITGELESNFLLNPVHPDFADVELIDPEPFWIDPRLG